MSSAILYVAIVVIWACVLIPRWLRRDSGRWSSHVPATEVLGDPIADDATTGEDIRAGTLPGKTSTATTAFATTAFATAASASASPADGPQAKAAPARPHERTEADEQPTAAAEDVPDPADQAQLEDVPPPPLTPEEVRRRVHAARRRLLGMLLALEAAAIALAVLGLAALWVVIPPSVMLGGYLLLLREASHADAERARREHEAARARARARERDRARRHAAQATAAPAAAGMPATPPPAADYDDAGPGRDFAPGLAGKYIASNAEVIDISGRAEEGLYGQYSQNKLRAVGD